MNARPECFMRTATMMLVSKESYYNKHLGFQIAEFDNLKEQYRQATI